MSSNTARNPVFGPVVVPIGSQQASPGPQPTPDESFAAEVADRVLQMLNDSVEGFNFAAEKLEDQKFAHACRRYAAERENLASELRPCVVAGGKQPTTATELRGVLSRGWMCVRSAIGSGDQEIINTIEAAEDHAVTAYREALASTDLLPRVRDVLARQYPLIMAAHDQFSAWKHARAAA